MRSLTLRKVAIVAVVPMALGTLAACGGGGDSTTAAEPQAPSSSAASPSGSATTDKGASGHRVDPAAFVNRVKAAARSLTTARFTMTMEVGGQDVFAKGALDMTGDQPAMQLSMDLSGMGTPTDIRLVDGSMYIQDPTSGTGKYIKMDLSDPNGPLGAAGDTFDSLNPDQWIAKVSPSSFRKVTDLGSRSQGGSKLEHYAVVIDTAAASRMFQDLPSTASLPKTLSYDVWLDRNDRIARFAMLAKKVIHFTARYSDYGADIHITAPPATQVVEMPSTSTGG